MDRPRKKILVDGQTEKKKSWLMDRPRSLYFRSVPRFKQDSTRIPKTISVPKTVQASDNSTILRVSGTETTLTSDQKTNTSDPRKILRSRSTKTASNQRKTPNNNSTILRNPVQQVCFFLCDAQPTMAFQAPFNTLPPKNNG
jgi:hypothetical protein